jgi:hypothetical protein
LKAEWRKVYISANLLHNGGESKEGQTRNSQTLFGGHRLHLERSTGKLDQAIGLILELEVVLNGPETLQ